MSQRNRYFSEAELITFGDKSDAPIYSQGKDCLLVRIDAPGQMTIRIKDSDSKGKIEESTVCGEFYIKWSKPEIDMR